MRRRNSPRVLAHDTSNYHVLPLIHVTANCHNSPSAVFSFLAGCEGLDPTSSAIDCTTARCTLRGAPWRTREGPSTMCWLEPKSLRKAP